MRTPQEIARRQSRGMLVSCVCAAIIIGFGQWVKVTVLRRADEKSAILIAAFDSSLVAARESREASKSVKASVDTIKAFIMVRSEVSRANLRRVEMRLDRKLRTLQGSADTIRAVLPAPKKRKG